MDTRDDDFRAQLIKNGTEKTRQFLSEGQYANRRKRIAEAWLEEQGIQDEGRDRREANLAASRANRLAIMANIIAATAVAISITDMIARNMKWW